MTTYKNYSLQKWIFTPDDIAYHVRVDPPPEELARCFEDDSLIPDYTDYYKNPLFLRFEEWEAILKYGVDRDMKPVVAPVVCYYSPDYLEIPCIFMATGGPASNLAGPPLGDNVSEQVTVASPVPLGPGDRAFFQQIEIPTSDEWEIIEEETP